MSSIQYTYLENAQKADLEELKWDNTASFWQSPLWANILTGTKQAEIIICTGKNTPILIERRHIWRKYTGLYILGARNELITEEFVQSLKESIVKPSDLFLQIEPIDSGEGNGDKAPFRRFLEPVTAVLDLKKSEEDLFAAFAEKGRYNIRLAQKRGLTTRWIGSSEVEAFYNLLEETTKRDKFSHNSLAYYKNFVEILEANKAGGLLIAEKDGVLHAAGIFAYYGDVGIYYYGASSSDPVIRRDMATYLLQWEAIREAKRRSCEIYDFLGISPDGKGKLAGVTEFKLRFNPEKKYFPAEKVVVFKPIVLNVLKFLSKLRKVFR